jgi:transposase-like protein
MLKRRRFTPQFKAGLALCSLRGAQTQAELCKQHHITAHQLKCWEAELQSNAHLAFGGGRQQELQERIAELERMVGRLTMQVEILKKASPLLDAPPAGEGRWPA